MRDVSTYFSDLLPGDAILTDQAEKLAYGTDTSRNFSGEAAVVLLPRSTKEVQSIVECCREQGLGIIPSGGRTGLCGGATATNGEVVVSLQRLNKIVDLNIDDRVAVVQAGVTNQQLKTELSLAGLDFPVSLASWGTCQIGGNIATNAGGIHVIRYGHTRNWVLGLTVVTGTGEVLKTGKPLRKDNTGYDLRSLFIGAEGTLGIITEAVLALTEKPEGLTRILCGVHSIADCLPLLREVRRAFSNLSAFEFFTDRALHHVTTKRKLRNPFEESYPCYVLVELESTPEEIESKVSAFFMEKLEAGAILDVVVAQNSKQSEEIMNLREWISETLSSEFTPHKNDISVPVSSIPEFAKELSALMEKDAPDYELILFGHVGDGNIHLNWLKPAGEPLDQFFKKSKAIDRKVLELVSAYGGSISAEHGIGLLKRDVLHLSRSPMEIQTMRAIKQLFDPDNIMNPGKIF